MNKILNLFFLICVTLFVLKIINYYYSQKNIKHINLNRSNIYKILENKALNLPILKNNTNNIIVFNETFTEDLKKNKSRSYWNLLKSK